MGSRDLDMKQGLQAGGVGKELLRTRVRPTWEHTGSHGSLKGLPPCEKGTKNPLASWGRGKAVSQLPGLDWARASAKGCLVRNGCSIKCLLTEWT